MIHRILEPREINAIANDQSVRALMFLGTFYPDGPLDFGGVLDDPKKVVLSDEHGFCAIFEWSSPGTYQCHIMAPKTARGASAMSSAREMLAMMRDDHGARLVWGQPSIYNRAAICFIRRMGLKSAGFGTDPMMGEVEYFVTEGL